MSKKILLNIFVLLLMSFSVVNAAKIETLRYDGVDHKYTGPEISLVLNGENFEIQENLMPPIVLDNRTLVPAREVFETLGGTVEWDSKEKRVDVELGSKTISLWIDNTEAKIDGNIVTTDVPAKIINSKTMVPARFISEQAGLTVDSDWTEEVKKVFIDIPIAQITNVEYLKIEETDCLVVTTDLPVFEYKYYMPETKDKLVLDIKNSKFKINTSTLELEDNLIFRVRYGNHEDENYNRIVLDLKEETDYVVVPSDDRTKLYFAMASEFTIPGEEQNTDDELGKSDSIGEEVEASGDISISGDGILGENKTEEEVDVENNTENDIVEDENNNDDEVPTEDKPQNIIVPDVYITSIKYSTISKRLKIAYDGDLEYTDTTYEEPYRIVFDIKNAELKTEGPKEIRLKNSGVISAIRFSQYENATDGKENLVRVVVDLKAEAEYKVYKRSSELQVTVSQQNYLNVEYKNNETNAQITLYDVDLDDLSKSRNEKKNRYIIKYSSSDFDAGEGEIEPDDEFIESINITDSKITIYDAGNMVYTMKQLGDNVVVTIKEKEEIKNKKVILIDAGHGGDDPGSNRDGYKEKAFNLKIATMLNELLSDHEELEVYMTRDDDTYLNRDQRVEIATEIDPHLIVSVHINSYDKSSVSGTEVLYYNKDSESNYGDITSKKLAETLLDKLVDTLGTVNRGTKLRDDQYILTKVACPSVICEICFISNDAELERLKTKSFQEDAAEAIYEGVVEILEIM